MCNINVADNVSDDNDDGKYGAEKERELQEPHYTLYDNKPVYSLKKKLFLIVWILFKVKCLVEICRENFPDNCEISI